MLSQRVRRIRAKAVCTECSPYSRTSACRCEGALSVDATRAGTRQNARAGFSPKPPCFENAPDALEQAGLTHCKNTQRNFNGDGDLLLPAQGVSGSSLSSTCLETEGEKSEVCHLSSPNVHSRTSRQGNEGCRCTHCGGGFVESPSGEGKAGSLQCPVCTDLGGALLCHECSSRCSRFEQSYRTSYLYKALRFGSDGAGFFGNLFTAWNRGCRNCSPNTFESESTIAAAVEKIRFAIAESGCCKKNSSSDPGRSCKRLQTRVRPSNTEEMTTNERQQPTLADKKDRQTTAHSYPNIKHRTHHKHRKNKSHAGNSNWDSLCESVNRLEETVVTLARRHPAMVWVLWSLLSLGFFCGLNCFLWPILALLFVLRRLRILAWEAAVRRLSPCIFSADLEAILINYEKKADESTQGSKLKKALDATEVLSLMESQEKLFFSMPWMAVTAYAYCDSLTLPELCTTITRNLLQPTEEFLRRLNRTADLRSSEHLPLSAFEHPRLLARVQRVLKRFCWVRQRNFNVSQQVMKFTKKGIDVLRQQHCKTNLNLEGIHFTGNVGDIPAEAEGICACPSIDECDCLVDESDLIFLVNEALSQPLDPQKPLWQFLLLENALFPSSIADESGKRVGSVVIFRMHHSVGDGVSITRMFLKDFLTATPDVVRTSETLRFNTQTNAEGKSASQYGRVAGDTERVLLHHSNSRDSSDGFEDPECSALNPKSGSSLSFASTSTTWAPSESSVKAPNDGNDTLERTPHREDAEPASPSSPVGVSPLKPSISVCKIPEGIFWKLLVAIRFALQLPFYAAANALLLRCEVLAASRSGSARRTKITRPICLPLKHTKELAEKLTVALSKHSSGHSQAEKGRFKSLFSWFSLQGTQPQQHLVHWRSPQRNAVNDNESEGLKGKDRLCMAAGRHSGGNDCKGSTVSSLRITLNDVFAACIVGGYHRYAALSKAGLTSRRQRIDGEDTRESLCWRENINFIVPVNLRSREEDAKDLRNRFASLVIPMPFSSTATSLERLSRVHVAMRRTLHSFALPMVMLLERWLYATWPDLLMVYFLRLTRKISVIYSSVIGPASLPYVCNSRIHGMNFVVPQPGEVGVGISAFSCGKNISLCVAADEMVVKDREILRDCIVAEYKSLCRICTDFQPMS